MVTKEETLWDHLLTEQKEVRKLETQMERSISKRNKIVKELYANGNGKSCIVIGRIINVSRQTIHKIVKEREG